LKFRFQHSVVVRFSDSNGQGVPENENRKMKLQGWEPSSGETLQIPIRHVDQKQVHN
jgi:hypothetical protein